jgi:putative rhamnosyltransferase
MNGKFTHYLITRFNVPVKNWDKDKAGKKVLDQAWLDERILIFRKYCVPTITNQSQKNFTWLIYCDVNTPPEYLSAVRQIIHEIPQATIRLVSEFDHLMIDLRQILADDPTPYVITSRMDNDDGLGKEYMQRIQEAFIPQDKTLLNFLHGIVYDVEKQILTGIRNANLNHFTSLIETKSQDRDYLTVLGFSHTRPPAHIVVKDLHSPNAWLKIIHGRNMNSRTKGKPVARKEILPFFNLTKKDVPISILQTAIYILRKGIHRIMIISGIGRQKKNS